MCLSWPNLRFGRAGSKASTLETWAETTAFRSEKTAPTKLYGAWFCPYSQCTFAQLEELADHGFNYQYVEIDPYRPRPDGLDSKQKLSIEEKRRKYPAFVKASPQGLIPALSHHRAAVWGCAECSQYLVDLLENNPRLSSGSCMGGSSAAERASVWAFWELCQAKIVPHFYRSLMLQSKPEQQSALESMLQGMREASVLMARQSPAGFFLGEQYSVADLSLAPWWQRLPLLQQYRGFQIPDEDEYARLKGWWEAVSSRPSYKRTMVDTARLIANYREYSDGTATSTIADTFARQPDLASTCAMSVPGIA
mmetsp:Transcript_6772/g.15868  ORF Transcript_6772/g.15868 Transcript_6772/m.15868 type:complete len:309 (-) Transcript_6772:294-1220(-)